MTKRFVSEVIEPSNATAAIGGEPQLPDSFAWHGEVLEVAAVVKTWRTMKDDRGDFYVKRHWFEFRTRDGRTAVVYFDRGAKRGQPRWWLYAITPNPFLH